MKRVPFGRVYAHRVTSAEALEQVKHLIAKGDGGYVVTPNVDHVVQAEHSDALAAAYDMADLSLVDGQPLLWLSRLMNDPLPEKISGSDFVPLLIERAAREGWRVFFLGAREGVGAEAARVLCAKYPDLQIVGIESPAFGFEHDPQLCERILQKVAEARADIIVVALGCPKQELLMHRWKTALTPAIAIGSGATLDFIAGNVRRAPAWMSRNGLEWLYRLAQQPRALAHRYLVRDRQFFRIAWRTWLASRSVPPSSPAIGVEAPSSDPEGAPDPHADSNPPAQAARSSDAG